MGRIFVRERERGESSTYQPEVVTRSQRERRRRRLVVGGTFVIPSLSLSLSALSFFFFPLCVSRGAIYEVRAAINYENICGLPERERELFG